MTYDDLVDRLMAQFDTTRSTVESVVNERLKELVVQAKWLVAERSLGSTVAGQASYAIAGDTADLRAVRIDGEVYEWAGEDEIDRLDSSSDKWAGAAFDTDGGRLLQVFPVPESSGSTITGIARTIPADLSYGDGEDLPIPTDMHKYLRAGCQADLYEEVDERPDLATPREQVFTTGIQRLRSRAAGQVKPGVTRIRVEGYHF